MILGNANLPHRGATRSFVEGVGWIAQIGLFVMLGLLSTPESADRELVLVAVVAGLFLTLVARPLSVLASVAPFRMPARQQVFLSWAGLRGAVPIVLATVPLSVGVPSAAYLFDVVLVFVDRLHLPAGADAALRGPPPRADQRRDRAARSRSRSRRWTRSPPTCCRSGSRDGSRLSGIEIAELRLPKDTVVSLIIRDATPFTPSARDRIKVGDELLVVTPTAQRDITEERLRSSGPRRPAGPLARSRTGWTDGSELRVRVRRDVSHPARATASVPTAGRRSASSPRWWSWRSC